MPSDLFEQEILDDTLTLYLNLAAESDLKTSEIECNVNLVDSSGLSNKISVPGEVKCGEPESEAEVGDFDTYEFEGVKYRNQDGEEGEKIIIPKAKLSKITNRGLV